MFMLCFLYLLFFTSNCHLCIGPVKHPKKRDLNALRSIEVEGKINERANQNFVDTIPNHIYFNEGQRIEYTCRKSMTNSNIGTRWIHEKGGTISFFGYPSYDNEDSRIIFDLYDFDDNSTIKCLEFDRFNNKTLSSIGIPMSRNSSDATPSEHIRTKTVTEGEHLKIECENKDDIVHAAPPNNNETIIDALIDFNFNRQFDGMTLYCVKINVSYSNGSCISKRMINSIQKLKLKHTASDNNYTSQSINGAQNRFSGDSIASLFSKEIIYGLIAIVGTIGVTTVLVILCTIRNRKRLQENPHVDVDKPEEPLYATAQQIIYAELQISDARLDRPIPPSEEASPYAEIVGVMAPCR